MRSQFNWTQYKLLISISEPDKREYSLPQTPWHRKPARKNEKFRPTVLSTGDTLVELLTRTKYALTQTPDKWSERTKERMELLFRLHPKIKESYDIVNKLRAIFRSTSLDREDNVLNYFIERSTNASAESLNSKMKAFRAQLRGVSDLPFFMYRVCQIFG